MLDLDAVSTFVAIATTGSFTATARKLALSKSVVSERLQQLERSLGTKLVLRTTRRVSLTSDGAAFYERARRLVREAELAAAEVAERHGKVAGSLRISAPVSFGYLHLGAALFGFIARYPEIDLTLDLDDRFVDLYDEGYDAVVRHGPIQSPRVIVKLLATSTRVLVASPSYLKRWGEPTSLEELGQHRAIVYSYRGAADWRFRVGRRFATVQPRTALRLNNGLLMRDAAAGGLGIALLPTFFLKSSQNDRTLKVIDVGVQAEGAALYIGYADHLRGSLRIRALTTWLQSAFGDPPRWQQRR